MAENTPAGYVSRETFEIILENAVIPTFDVILEVPGKGVLIVRRTIAPYKDSWALPGLRMYKGEAINDTLTRVVEQETGLSADLKSVRMLGQFVGKFTTEHNRQDLSTCYVIQASTEDLRINEEHFSSSQFISEASQIPDNMGAMYKYYLNKYFEA